jgi:DNA-directed RNA polymerase specialized sigma24 family protein
MESFRYEPERCSFKGWLMHVTRGHIKDSLRRRRTQARWFEPMDTAEAGLVEEIADEGAERRFEAAWSKEWENQLLTAAERRVRSAISPQHYEI